MTALSWLLVHGSIVWKVALGLSLLAGLAAAYLRPRVAARLAAMSARWRLGRPRSARERWWASGSPRRVVLEDGARVTLRGRIEAPSGLAVRFEDGEGAAVASVALTHEGRAEAGRPSVRTAVARAEKLVVLVGDAVIELEGRVDLMAGSREIHRGDTLGSLPQAIDARVSRALESAGSRDPLAAGQRVVFRSVAHGDTVRVSGVLHEEAAEEGRSYREAARSWTLRPDGSGSDGAAVKLAFDGAPRVSGPGPWPFVAGATGGAAVFAAVFGLGGEIAMGLASREITAARFERDAAGGAMRATAFALSTPLRRDHALEELAFALDARRDPEPEEIALRAALRERRGDCAGAAAVWASHGHEARGAELAEACGAHRLAARAWYAIGEFKLASVAWERAQAISEEARVASATLGFRSDASIAAGERADATWAGTDFVWQAAANLHPGASRASGSVSDYEQLEDAILGAEAGLLSGRLDTAERAARHLHGLLRGRRAEGLELARWFEARAALAQCLAQTIDVKRGASEKATACDSWASAPGCALLSSDVAPAAERTGRLRAAREAKLGAHEVPRRWLELLAAETEPAHVAAPPPAFDVAAAVLTSPGNTLPLSMPALERDLAETPAREPLALTSRSRAAASAAVFAMAAGDHAAARRLARIHVEAEQSLVPETPVVHGTSRRTPVRAERRSASRDDRAPYRHALELAAVVEIAAGDLDRAEELAARAKSLPAPGSDAMDASTSRRGLEGLLALARSGETGELLDFLGRMPPPNEDEKRAWSFAGAGEGEALARWLRQPRSEVGAFLRIGAARAHTGKNALLAWIAWGHRPPGLRRPIAQLAHLANLAAAAEALGDGELAASRRAQARRFYEALLRRDTAVPLAVLERF